jgi:hypothetical protein
MARPFPQPGPTEPAPKMRAIFPSSRAVMVSPESFCLNLNEIGMDEVDQALGVLNISCLSRFMSFMCMNVEILITNIELSEKTH